MNNLTWRFSRRYRMFVLYIWIRYMIIVVTKIGVMNLWRYFLALLTFTGCISLWKVLKTFYGISLWSISWKVVERISFKSKCNRLIYNTEFHILLFSEFFHFKHLIFQMMIFIFISCRILPKKNVFFTKAPLQQKRW